MRWVDSLQLNISFLLGQTRFFPGSRAAGEGAVQNDVAVAVADAQIAADFVDVEIEELAHHEDATGIGGQVIQAGGTAEFGKNRTLS